MFDDKRSKKIVLVAHCILNQNCELTHCAKHPGAIEKVVSILVNHGIGIIQMPCPELLFIGLKRQAAEDTTYSIEDENSRIAVKMETESAKRFCRAIALQFIIQVQDYQKNGFQILGVVGINASPTCGIETTWKDGLEKIDFGAYTKILNDELNKMQIPLPMVGIKADNCEEAEELIEDLILNK